MGTEWHFDTDLEGWVGESMHGWLIPSVPAHVVWDNSQYHSSPGSVLFNVDGLLDIIYSTSLICYSGDVLSCWIRPTPGGDDDSGRELTLLISFSDASTRWVTYDEGSLPMNVWTQFSVTVQAGDVGKTINELTIVYDGGWYGDSGGYIFNAKAWIDDVTFINLSPASPSASLSASTSFPPPFPYIYRSATGGSSFADITPAGMGAIGHRGLLASVQAQNNVVALVSDTDISSMDLVVSDSAGAVWTVQQTGMAMPVDISGWDVLFFADASAPWINKANGLAGSYEDCLGNWLTAVGEPFAAPTRVALIW